MPHYLIHGADQTTAKDRIHIVHCVSGDQASRSASDAGLFVSSVEALDAGQPAKPNDGTSGGWLRMATLLNRQDRYDEAVELLYLTYQLIDLEGGGHGVDTYLKLSNYLVLAGRDDDAWGYLSMLKFGKVKGTSGICLVPHNLGDIHRRMSKLCKGHKADLQMLIAKASDLVGEVFVGRCKAADGVERLNTIFAESSVSVEDPQGLAAKIGKHLIGIDDFRDQGHRVKGLKAVYVAETVIHESIGPI